jgi:two-component system, OmpR family, phosphate regulon sensor histidine kinase PhoR
MLHLTLIALLLALIWLGRRYWLLRRGVGLLADAVSQGRSFLHDDAALPELHPDWRRLVSESARLVQEVATLKQQRVGQLSQLETTLSSLQEGVVIVDRDNYVVLANSAVSRIFPGAEHAVGKRIESILHSVTFLQLLEVVRRGTEPGHAEIQFLEQGRSVWIEATGAVVPESNEPNAPWCLFVLHDISRQKKLEAVRKEFVANVSHELKTPLSMIRGYAETLADHDGSLSAEDRMKFAQTIHRHSGRLSAIVDDLLTISRLESTGAVLEPSWHEVSEILDAAADEFRARLERTGHRFSYARPEESFAINIDSLRVGQVLGNLLENAQKYTPTGTRIELGARLDHEKREVEIWVADEGPGIPAADLPRIFERFYRVEKGRSRDKGGTGLGLSIVKHIVQLHGGRVAAQSVVGQGTRIAFWLPAGRPTEATTQGEQAVGGRTLGAQARNAELTGRQP